MLEAYRHLVKVKSIHRRARESAPWLRALDSLAENPGLIPDDHTAAHNNLELQYQEIHLFLPDLDRHQAHM